MQLRETENVVGLQLVKIFPERYNKMYLYPCSRKPQRPFKDGLIHCSSYILRI